MIRMHYASRCIERSACRVNRPRSIEWMISLRWMRNLVGAPRCEHLHRMYRTTGPRIVHLRNLCGKLRKHQPRNERIVLRPVVLWFGMRPRRAQIHQLTWIGTSRRKVRKVRRENLLRPRRLPKHRTNPTPPAKDPQPTDPVPPRCRWISIPPFLLVRMLV